MNKIKFISAGFLLISLAGCASFGPIDTAEFEPKIRHDIPAIEGRVLAKAPAVFLPGINGYSIVGNFFEAGPFAKSKTGLIVLTEQKLYFAQWNSGNYHHYWDLDYGLITSLEIRSMGRGKRLVLNFSKHPNVASFDITSNGTFIDARKTTTIGQLIASRSGKHCKLP
ncbi:MAG: hypothetical protein AB7E95_06530 [Kiritimatiellales bacterium]